MGAFAVLGLNADDERVYTWLASSSAGTAVDLAHSIELGVGQVSACLAKLLELGLVLSHPGEPPTYSACPVAPAIDTLISTQQAALTRARTQAEALAAARLRQTERRSPHELVAIVVGLDNIAAQYSQLQRNAKVVVRTFDRPPYVLSTSTAVNVEGEQRKAAGIEYRTIYDRALLDEPETLTRIQRELDLGENGRVLPHLPFKMAIADRSVALLPLTEDSSDEQAALLLRPSVLLDSLIALFEVSWERGVSVPRASASTNAATEHRQAREIVAMLATGMKDETIARHLGISERTTRRRIAEAMTTLGAETRFQAGLRAKELGWL